MSQEYPPHWPRPFSEDAERTAGNPFALASARRRARTPPIALRHAAELGALAFDDAQRRLGDEGPPGVGPGPGPGPGVDTTSPNGTSPCGPAAGGVAVAGARAPEHLPIAREIHVDREVGLVGALVNDAGRDDLAEPLVRRHLELIAPARDRGVAVRVSHDQRGRREATRSCCGWGDGDRGVQHRPRQHFELRGRNRLDFAPSSARARQ